MANGNQLMELWMKEQRAANFHRTLEALPVVADPQLEARIGQRIGGGTTVTFLLPRRRRTSHQVCTRRFCWYKLARIFRLDGRARY